MHSNYRRVIARNKRRQIFKRIVGVLCCIVVFCTTYALILPAITMENKALCGVAEHTHTEDCYQKRSGQTMICGQQEQEGHAHGDSCYVPGETEALSVHSHNNDCYSQGELICGTEADHVHGEACFKEQIICETEDEAHVHDDACLEWVMDCEVEENHTHSESCYEWTVSCGLEEGQQAEAEPAEPVLVCTEPVVEAHTHDDTCFAEAQSGFVTVCGNTDEDHSHSSKCYELECVLPEHEHTLICFSDPEADVETAGVWEATFADVALTGNNAEDLVAIAQSQLGYTESSRNYDEGEGNTLHGYTRYGAWFGDPYGEWDAMFVSFCLRYAGVDGMPGADSVSSLRSALSAAGLYCSAKETKAQKGNLIFLDTDADGVADRVGIVAQVQEAQEHTGDSVKTIEGDVSGSVRYQYYAPDASQILGYGLLPGQERIPVAEDPVTEEETVSYICGISAHAHGEDCHDADGSLFCDLEEHIHDAACAKDPTAVYIESVSESVVVTYSAIRVQEMAQTNERTTFRMYSAPMPVLDEDTGEGDTEEGETGIRNLQSYVAQHSGELSLVMLTTDNQIPPSENGAFIIEKDTEYLLSLGFSVSEHGMEKGIYEYQFPDYFIYTAQSGKLYDSENSNIELGQWTLDASGRMEFEFYEISNHYQSVSMTVSIKTTVKDSVETFDFDGTIYVVVEPEEDGATQMSLFKLSEAVTGSNQIQWNVSVIPGTEDTLLGMVVTDTLESDQHYFSENDKNQGITIGFNSGGDWHQITVQPTWIGDSGFEFVIPEKTCEFCHNTFTYTPGTQYYIVYTTTVREDLADGYYIHKNNVMVGDKSAPGSYGHYIGVPKSKVVKTGRLDPATQDYKWTVQATIPAYTSGKPVYWQLVDWARIVDVNVPGWALKENFQLTQESFESVTAYYNGRSVTVPHVSQVTPQDPFCYYFFYDEKSGQNFLYLAAPCDCTEEKCATTYPLNHEWCESYIWDQNNRETVFCKCWTVPYDVVVTYNMVFDGEHLIKTYGGQNLTFVNSVGLSSNYMNSNREYISTPEADDYGMIEVPGMMKKTLVDKADSEKNGNVASFNITVNESKMDLSQLGTQGGSSNVSIVDTMSEFLYYIPGSMVITREDQNNQMTVMQYGTDYAMNVNGHTLTVELLSPGPYKYELDYEARVIAQNVVHPPYENWADVYLGTTSYSSEKIKAVVANYTYAASSYSVTLHKTCANSGQALSGATFGLYAENGELMAQDVTNNDGDIIFVTDLKKNVVYQLHEPYYLQEISAPEGYMLDKTKHWFYICNVEDGICTDCANVPDHEGMVKAPEQTVQAQNTFGGPILPNTGGTGKELYTVGGMLLILAAAVLLYNQKKCRKEDHQPF